MYKKRIKQIFTIIPGLLLYFIASALPSLARNDNFVPNVDIPGLNDHTIGQVVGSSFQSTLLAKYITSVYDYILAIAGIIAAVVLMGGGVLWLVSSGSPDRVKKAKDIITNSLIGLVLLFSSYLILNFINPELTKMKPITVPNIVQDGSLQSGTGGCCICEFTFPGNIGEEKTCSDGPTMSQEACNYLCNNDKRVTRKDLPATAVANLSYGRVCDTPVKELGPVCILPTASDFTNIFDQSNWTFTTNDGDISKQVGDVSPELGQLLNCIASKVGFKGIITSISDKNYVGNLSECDKPNCDKSSSTACVHACGSCHYGGGMGTNKSYAVDIGDTEHRDEYQAAVRVCDPGAYFLDEGNHLHISSSKCPKN